MSNLRDPIHFFDAFGSSLMQSKHLLREVERLEEENAQLRRLLQSALLRKEFTEEPEESDEPDHPD